MSDIRTDADAEEQSRAKHLQERKAAKQAAAQLKERRRRQKKIKSKCSQLEREQKFADVSYERAAKEWEQMMVDVNHFEMRVELQVLRDDMRMCLDNREQVIRRLGGQRDEARDQHSQHARWQKGLCDMLRSKSFPFCVR